MSVPSIAFYPPLPPGAPVRRAVGRLPYPLEEDGCELFSRGRHAIWQAARALGLGPGDSVLAPAWHHGAEIEALCRAGIDVAFYDLGPALGPVEDELDSLLEPRTRALFITHYLGFAQEAARWRAWCDERGLLLIEDAAHACLAQAGDRPAGSFGDAAMWCLFKSFAVPDGAALRLAGRAPKPGGERALGSASAARREASWLLQRSPGMARAIGKPGSSKPYDHAAELALGDPGTAPSSATTWLLPRVALEDAAPRRRANYQMLLEELREAVPPPFDRLPPGAVPLGLPIRCKRKGTTLERLDELGIDAVDFWSEPHPLLGRQRFPEAERMRTSTVLLPVHQELRPVDLERVTAAAKPRRSGAGTLRAETAGSIGELHDEWSELAQRTANVFATPEWASSWCRHFLNGRPLRLLAFRSAGGRLVAVLPLYVFSSRPVRILRVVGHGPGEALGPICEPGDRARVARALLRALPELGADLLLAEHVSREAGWSAFMSGRVLRTEASPVLRLDAPDWERFLGSLPRNLRKELRRSERRLEREHGLRYRLSADATADVERDLDAFFSLHEARWRDGGSRFLAHGAFHRDFARVAAERGWLRVWVLEAGGRDVAASYGFRFGGVEFDYQSGRDPDWSGPSLGLVLQARSIRAALEDGVGEYRLLRGDSLNKRRFATGDPGLETFAVALGALGGAVVAVGAGLPEPISTAVRRRLAA